MLRPAISTITALATLIAAAGVACASATGARPERPRVIVVQMTHDSTGMRFHPSRVVATSGDTLRFVNGAGRHDVDFVADSNPRGVTLPARTPVLEHAGDSTDVRVSLPSGTYYFQCDPHAAMGMTGHLVVMGARRGA